MKVNELIAHLKTLPQDMSVMVRDKEAGVIDVESIEIKGYRDNPHRAYWEAKHRILHKHEMKDNPDLCVYLSGEEK